jgi:transglutaminase-like putative cysteine protease
MTDASSTVQLAPAVARPRIARSASVDRDTLAQLTIFALLSGFAAWRYVSIETSSPAARVVAITATALAAAAAVRAIRAPRTTSKTMRAAAAVARVIVLIAAFAVALLAAGVPGHLLHPAQWGMLADRVRGGLDTLSLTRWPYTGSSRWARVDILMALAAVSIAAAGLAFWPRGGDRRLTEFAHGARRLAALALLLTLYVVGVLDGRTGWTTAEGLLLLALLAGWLWLPGSRPPQPGHGRGPWWAAPAWLAVGGAVAALAGQLVGGRAWLDYRAWNLFGSDGPSVAFGWDQTYGPITWSRSSRVMFTVAAARSQLWKTTTLDRFDGLRFVRSGTNTPSYQDLPLPVNDQWYTFAKFSIQSLRSALLPAEQGTTMGVNIDLAVSHDLDGTSRTPGAVLPAGESYTVLAYVPDPTAAELRAAPRAFPVGYLRYTDFDLPAGTQSGLNLARTDPAGAGNFDRNRTVGAREPGIPPAATPGVRRRVLGSPYGPMFRLAQRLAFGKRTTYDVVLAVENYVRSNYTYSEQPPARRYPLESFLFEDRIGYCQQFSGAMALMLRMDGVPARVAAGFLPGTYDRTAREFTVRAVDAHSWVEVYFSGIGWVPFNPTPPRPLSAKLTGPTFASERSVSLAVALAGLVGARPHALAARRTGGQGGPEAGATGGVSAVLIAGAAAGVLALVTLAAGWLAGRRRLRRSLDGDSELAAHELVHALRRLGYAVPATVTLAQIEQQVHLHGGSEAARYVRLLRQRLYAADGARSATLRDRRRLRHALTAHLGLDARLRGLWALPPATVGWRSGARHPGGP